MSRPSGTGTRFKDVLKSKLDPLLHQRAARTLEEKFFAAVYTRNIPEINKYLKLGVNLNACNEAYGVTPLHLIAERNDYILGYRLIQMEGINLEVQSVHGETPLGLTALCNCKRFAAMLLKYGHSPNVANRLGKTPLHQAIEMEHYGIIVKLLKAGASVNVLDCFENTPLSLSILDVKNSLFARTLFQYGANFRIERKRSLHIFFETILNCHYVMDIDFVVLLLDNGIDVNMREEKSGRNCLHYVAMTGFLELAVVLIERGVNWNVVDVQQRTPSRVALDHGNDILADYFRKGYRPPRLLTVMPLLHIWTNKLKARLEEKKKTRDTDSLTLSTRTSRNTNLDKSIGSGV